MLYKETFRNVLNKRCIINYNNLHFLTIAPHTNLILFAFSLAARACVYIRLNNVSTF